MLYDFYAEEKEALSLIASVWVDSENIFENFEAWQEIWDYGFLSADRQNALMDAEEIATLASMPDTFEIYRGTSYRSSVKGMSWTIDKKKAIWFAKRFNQTRKPLLASATVRKENVLAFFRCRNESEIVVNPEMIQNLVIKEIK